MTLASMGTLDPTHWSTYVALLILFGLILITVGVAKVIDYLKDETESGKK